VEGAEGDVLKGLLPTISEIHLPAILCELVPSSDKRWLNTIDQIAGLMSFGYKAFRLEKWGELSSLALDDVRALNHTENIVFAVQDWLDART
jgi:hypothetical protein